MPAPIVTLGFLAVMGLALLVWERLRPQTEARGYPEIGVLTLAVAIALLLGLRGAPWPQSAALTEDGLARLSGAMFLGAALLQLAYDQQTRHDGERSRLALRLFALLGGLLVITSQDLALQWIGLTLYLWANQVAAGCLSWTRGLLAPALLGLGIAMVYAASGTLDQRVLAANLWQTAGQPRLLFAGIALCASSLALALGLLPLLEDAGDASVPSATLGIVALARLGLMTMGALPAQWQWLTLAMALLLALYGGVRLLRTRAWAQRLVYLGMLHKSLLLLALAVAGSARGLGALLGLLLAYILGQSLLDRLTLWEATGDVETTPGNGWLRDRPTHGAALLVALLSCMGMLFTLGFAGRIDLIGAAQSQDAWGVVGTALLVSVLGAVGYVPLILGVFARPEGPSDGPSPIGYYGWLALLLSTVTLVALGVMRAPMAPWVTWIVAS